MGRPRFTRIPKTYDLIQAGCPTEVIPVYCALADYANNRTGLCWPRMETLARRLSRSPRTIQRHLHLLKELGLIKFVERKRDGRGRFGAYVYKVLHIAAAASSKNITTGQSGQMDPLNRKTKRSNNPLTPRKSKDDQRKRRREGYSWLFGDPAPPERDHETEERRRKASERRREDWEFLFK